MSNLGGGLGIFKPRVGSKADEVDGRRRRRRQTITTGSCRGGEDMTTSDVARH